MDTATALVAIIGAVLLCAMSPGPSFVLIVRSAVATSRRAAIAAAFGMALGGILFATAALLGLHVLLTSVPTLHFILKLGGAAYLLYIAVMLWRGADSPVRIEGAVSDVRHGWRGAAALGLATQLSNPKTAIVYASIFTALLPADWPAWLAAVLLPSIFVVEFGWYAVVALAFSSEVPRRSYLRWKRWVDRAAGAVMGCLAARLMADAR
jgi:threonine/homoserine/homoserine lactone efflux protein